MASTYDGYHTGHRDLAVVPEHARVHVHMVVRLQHAEFREEYADSAESLGMVFAADPPEDSVPAVCGTCRMLVFLHPNRVQGLPVWERTHG